MLPWKGAIPETRVTPTPTLAGIWHIARAGFLFAECTLAPMPRYWTCFAEAWAWAWAWGRHHRWS